jgi:hypothetical protein
MNKDSTETIEEQYKDERLKSIETNIDFLAYELDKLTRTVDNMAKALKETQQFAIKIGVSHQRLSERVASWPIIKIKTDEE